MNKGKSRITLPDFVADLVYFLDGLGHAGVAGWSGRIPVSRVRSGLRRLSSMMMWMSQQADLAKSLDASSLDRAALKDSLCVACMKYTWALE